MLKNSEERLCRICNAHTKQVIDLGKCPPANNFIDSLSEDFNLFPLVIDFCNTCKNLQLRDCLDEEDLYRNYSYMTPNTISQVDHYQDLISYLQANSFLDESFSCLELGSNTGLFLKNLKPHVNKVLGIDPASNIAEIANSEGIETIADFFNLKSAQKIKEQSGLQDLILARHMFAHNKDPKSMLEGVLEIISDRGVVVIENAYAIPTLLNGEFDQIYHEHMFYFNATSMQNLLKLFSMELIDIYETDLHGGSLVFIASKMGKRNPKDSVTNYIKKESAEFEGDKIFNKFDDKLVQLRKDVLSEIDKDTSEGRSVAAYGATAKSFTMFSYLNLNVETIKYCVDTTPTKIGKIYPHFNIPIISEDEFIQNPSDTLIVTAWNYRDHIVDKSKKIMKKGTKLIFPLPNFEVIKI